MSTGNDIILTIKSVNEKVVVGNDGKEAKCIVATVCEDYKPLILNKTNIRTIEKDLKYGPFVEDWIGKKIQVYATKTKAFGDLKDTFRIRPSIPKEKSVPCNQCGKQINSTKGQDGIIYTSEQVSKKLNGLCLECWNKARNKDES